MARWKKVKFGPRLGPRLYLGPNDFIIDFGRPFDADSGNVGQKKIIMRRLAARWLQSWTFSNQKRLPFRVQLTDCGAFCV